MSWSQDGAIFGASERDRKSTRLNSSHSQISYAVFCLTKQMLHSSSDFAALTVLPKLDYNSSTAPNNFVTLLSLPIPVLRWHFIDTGRYIPSTHFYYAH